MSNVEPSAKHAKAELPVPQTARFVRLEALSEKTGQPWASIAELNVFDSTGQAIDRKAWTVGADSESVSDRALNAIDGNPGTFWHSRWEGSDPPPFPHSFTVDLGSAHQISGFGYLPRQDAIVNGMIATYRFYVSSDGKKWGNPVASGDFTASGEPGIEQNIVFARQTGNHAPVAKTPENQHSPMGRDVKLQIDGTDADGDPIRYRCVGLPAGLSVSSESGLVTGTPIAPNIYHVQVFLTDGKSEPTSLHFEWTVDSPPPLPQDIAEINEAKHVGEIRFVKLEELSEVNGKPWASVAELRLLDAAGVALATQGWIASADSSNASDGPANAIDGNSRSLWHTQWDDASPSPPHSLIIDLGRMAAVAGFQYVPRQDGVNNGTIARFRFYKSRDGEHWGAPAAEGDFSSMGNIEGAKTVMLRSTQ